MDDVMIEKLEQARRHTPRYLYRSWINSPDGPVSGGHVNLNTPSAITPLAFSLGNGSSNVYRLTQKAFTDMALDHLAGYTDIETEFSSWAASLDFILNFCFGCIHWKRSDEGANPENCYVSMIDTKQLWDTNPIFHVPRLDFLSPRKMGYNHEYLAHGVIKGPAHRAISIKSISLGRFAFSTSTSFSKYSIKSLPITPENVKAAREIGEMYGGAFALPMTLAILSCQKQDLLLFRKGVKTKEFDILLNGIRYLEMPQDWDKDGTILTNVVHTKHYDDLAQTIALMRALANHWKEQHTWMGLYASRKDAVRLKQLPFRAANSWLARKLKELWTNTKRAESEDATVSLIIPAPRVAWPGPLTFLRTLHHEKLKQAIGEASIEIADFIFRIIACLISDADKRDVDAIPCF